MIFPFKYEKRRRYPGLLKKDVLVWETFIDHFPGYFSSCDYNVRVGEGIIIDHNWHISIQNMATALTQLRIDVIGESNNDITIIELKPYGSCTAIGQLLAYTKLYADKYTNYNELIPLLLCFYCPPDIKKILEFYDIQIIEVPHPEPYV